MALDHSNSSSLKQLALKGLIHNTRFRCFAFNIPHKCKHITIRRHILSTQASFFSRWPRRYRHHMWWTRDKRKYWYSADRKIYRGHCWFCCCSGCHISVQDLRPLQSQWKGLIQKTATPAGDDSHTSSNLGYNSAFSHSQRGSNVNIAVKTTTIILLENLARSTADRGRRTVRLTGVFFSSKSIYVA